MNEIMRKCSFDTRDKLLVRFVTAIARTTARHFLSKSRRTTRTSFNHLSTEDLPSMLNELVSMRQSDAPNEHAEQVLDPDFVPNASTADDSGTGTMPALCSDLARSDALLPDSDPTAAPCDGFIDAEWLEEGHHDPSGEFNLDGLDLLQFE